MSILSILEAVFGIAEPIILAHIHDPKTQQVATTVVTTVNALTSAVDAHNTKVAATPPTPTVS
jgi:hypothetical protein